MASMGSSQSSGSTQSGIQEWAKPFVLNALKRGQQVANQGYTPYMGMDIAGMNNLQQGGIQNAADWSAAFNTPGQAAPNTAANLPPTTTQNGMTGYSSYSMPGGYLDQMEKLKSTYPGMFRYIESMAINPVTGRQGNFPPSAPGSAGSGPAPAGSGPAPAGSASMAAPAGAASMAAPAGAGPSGIRTPYTYDPTSREAILFGTGGLSGGGGGGEGGGGKGGFDFNSMLNGMLGMSGGSASLEGIGNFWDPNNQAVGTYRKQRNNPFLIGSNNTMGMGNMGFGSKKGTG